MKGAKSFAGLAMFLAASACAIAEEKQAVALKDDPCHKLVLENEKVRVWEVNIPIGDDACPPHEHTIDMISVRMNTTDITNVPASGLFRFRSDSHVEAGSMLFSEYDKSPYAHRIIPTGSLPHRVVEFELLTPPADARPRDARPGFTTVFDKARARASRLVLQPSQSADIATPANTLMVVVRGGSLSAKPLAPADVQWFAQATQRTVRNDGKDPIEWVEIEVK
jgi:hypothetical protein